MAQEIPVINPRVHDEEINKLKNKDCLKLWTKPHMSYINAYRSHSAGGQGLDLAIPKDQNQDLLDAFESGRDTWVEVEKKQGILIFRGFHLTQEHLDQDLAKKRAEFAEEIRKPYRPKATMYAWLRTIGDLPFEEGMTLDLISKPRDFYIAGLGHPVSFKSQLLDQTTHLTNGNTAKVKIIRADLSGYDASAVVIANHTNRSQVLEDGILKTHHTAEIVVTFTPRAQ